MMNPHQYDKWSKVREKGKTHFVWFNGVLFWGILTGIMWSVVMMYVMPNKNPYVTFIIALILFPISGYWGSKWTWHRNEKQYEAHNLDNHEAP
jgi:putative flippase GtrA